MDTINKEEMAKQLADIKKKITELDSRLSIDTLLTTLDGKTNFDII